MVLFLIQKERKHLLDPFGKSWHACPAGRISQMVACDLHGHQCKGRLRVRPGYHLSNYSSGSWVLWEYLGMSWDILIYWQWNRIPTRYPHVIGNSVGKMDIRLVVYIRKISIIDVNPAQTFGSITFIDNMIYDICMCVYIYTYGGGLIHLVHRRRNCCSNESVQRSWYCRHVFGRWRDLRGWRWSPRRNGMYILWLIYGEYMVDIWLIYG